MSDISFSLFKNTELLPILLTMFVTTVLLVAIFKFVPIPWNTHQIEKPKPHIYKSSILRAPLRKKDWFAITLITALYAIVSLWHLGATTFPHTTWQPTQEGQSVVLELNEDTHFDSIYAIYGEGDNNSNLNTYQLGFNGIQINGSNDGQTWDTITTLEDGSIYQYRITRGDYSYRYIKIICNSMDDTLSEIGFKAYGEDRFLPITVFEDEASNSKYPANLLIDEQNALAIDPIYYDEGYFDEVYHPRNAWEIANGQYMYASVHPLLGTSMIALSIKILGMNPFAWRFAGALFGILLVPLFYFVCHELFGRSKLATLGTIFFACDFMHLTTSRIATLEPFSVFWILLMFYFMIRYVHTSMYDTPFKTQMKWLFLCGISMGLGIATKWTACYSAVGLAVLLFTSLIAQYLELREATKSLNTENPEGSLKTSEEMDQIEFMKKTYPVTFWKTIGFCFLFFIFIPILIYWIAYIPTKVWRDGWSVSNVLKQIQYMYEYHVNLEATHPYQSTWYQWILDLRPIWYFGRSDASGLYHSIACFSNPLLCWGGLLSILYTAYATVRKKDTTGWIIFVGYLSAFLPWVGVQRCVFAYHFYPSSVFMILSLVYAIRDLLKQFPKSRPFIQTFTILVILIFFLFLPATAGFGTSSSYIKFLEWLPTWYFG